MFAIFNVRLISLVSVSKLDCINLVIFIKVWIKIDGAFTVTFYSLKNGCRQSVTWQAKSCFQRKSGTSEHQSCNLPPPDFLSPVMWPLNSSDWSWTWWTDIWGLLQELMYWLQYTPMNDTCELHKKLLKTSEPSVYVVWTCCLDGSDVNISDVLLCL